MTGPMISAGAGGAADVVDDNSRTTVLIVLLLVLSANSGILFGYDTGIVSGAMLLIKPQYHLPDVWHELIVSGTVASAWAFSLCGGILTDRFGRRKTILTAAVVFTAGALVMGLAGTKEVLLVGRVIVGVGIGLASMSTPVYIAECASAKFRGLLVSLYALGSMCGQFIAGLISGGLSTVEDGWRWMLGLAAVPSVILLVGFYFLPESPRWLVAQGRVEEAERVLQRLRGPDAKVGAELQAIQKACDEQEEIKRMNEHQNVLKRIWTTRYARRALILGCVVQSFQQLGGINTVMYYSASIIQMAGIGDPSTAIWLSAGVAFVNFICGPIGMFLVDRVGRRPLILVSIAGSAFSLLALGGAFYLMDSDSPGITDVNTLGDACSALKTCAECVSTQYMCGFCYADGGASTCWPRNATDAALDGPCLDPTAASMKWAVGFCPSQYSWIAVLMLVVYLFFFSPGMGTIPWVLNAEIHPIWARDTSTSLATSCNWMFNLLVSLTFLSLIDAISAAGTFVLFSLVALTGCILIWLLLPETKGVGLEDMEIIFDGPVSRRGKATSSKISEASSPEQS